MQRAKFQQKVRDEIVKPHLEAQTTAGYGIILNYNKVTNTANVLMAQNGSDLPGEMLVNVPCPVQLGVVSVNPEKGRKCWVSFKDNNGQFPVISHFYNEFYDRSDYPKQSKAVSPLPRFVYGM